MNNASCPLAVLALGLILVAGFGCAGRESFPPPPATEVKPVTDVVHGVEITDNYRWLEDQQSPETRAWIDAQNAYTDEVLGGVPGRDETRARLEKLMQVEDRGIPREYGGSYFYKRIMPGQDQAVTYVREGLEGEDRVLLDPMAFAEDGSVSVSLSSIKDDGSLVAYSLRSGGKDEVEYRFRDVETGEDLPDVLPTSRYYGIELVGNDGRYVFTQMTEDGPRVYDAKLGSDERKVIFGEGYGTHRITYTILGEDNRYLVIHVLEGSSGARTEVWLHDLQKRGAKPVPVNTKLEATFQGQVVDGMLLLQTNHEAAGSRVVAVPASKAAEGKWKELIPEREGAVLRGLSLVGGRIFANYLENVQTKVVSYDMQGQEVGEIAFESIGTIGGAAGHWNSDEVFFSFSSFHMPSRIYRYDVSTGEQSVWFQPDVPIDSDAITVKQVWYKSKDGTDVPMFVVHRKDFEPTGDAPTLVYGYGGFRVPIVPRFSEARALFVERGGVYVATNLRGGGEFGEPWHQAGMLDNKQNTFDDYYAAVEHLIAEGYTNSEKVALLGGSNGGLLTGAAMTQRPELVQAIICTYPLLDMVRYDKFLVAKYWVPEYGTADDEEQFKWLHSYSPYHHVKQGVDYPATLFITGDGDTRVAPLHGRKMAALVQANSALNRPVMLRYHTDQGARRRNPGLPADRGWRGTSRVPRFAARGLARAGLPRFARHGPCMHRWTSTAR